MGQRKGRGAVTPAADDSGLTGIAAAQVGAARAMRARDVARPRPADVARAERVVVTKRRPAEPGQPR